MDRTATIVAPATPAGEGGIGIVRLSGGEAEAALGRFFRASRPVDRMQSHRLYHGRFVGPSGSAVDEVMAVVMRAPHSYTREDVVEVHCHGGALLVRQILDLFIDYGLRLAAPGEFTLRAFLNGRIDLAEAEGVIDLIRSRSEAASRIALQQVEGRLSRHIYRFRDALADLLSLVEAYIDFPDEDIELPHQDQLLAGAREILGDMERLLSGFENGRVLREGLSVLILGRPNVGKSSLLNALLGEARAIVTEIAGTTRDTIEENLTLGGIPLRLVDTAGVRATLDPVEAEGVRRAQEKVRSADLVLLVLDGSTPPGEDDLLALQACGDARLLLVLNKADLPPSPLPAPFADLAQVGVSAHSGAGLDTLRERIVGFFQDAGGAEQRESTLLCDRRHRQALVQAKGAIEQFCLGLDGGLSPEFLALDLRQGLDALGQITGETTPDDILERIFSKFCIGK